tara:strand:+ start:993 stop:1226 length:234 start_codon:yes stop_codon:yes gene_type:complete
MRVKMQEVYNDLNRLKEIYDQIYSINNMEYTKNILVEMIEEKEQIIDIHNKELSIQGGKELITEIFGSAMATKMGVL